MARSHRFTLSPGERRILVYGVLAVVVVLVVAVIALVSNEGDGDESAAGEVRDLMTIVEDGLIEVVSNGDGTATLFVTTTIDVVCAVAYGPTEDLGFLSTDDDMAGGGHSAQAEALRDLGTGCQILLDLGLQDLCLLTNSARPIVGIEAYGLRVVERRPLG